MVYNLFHSYLLQQRLFYVEDSLEAAVAGERVGQIIARTEKVYMF